MISNSKNWEIWFRADKWKFCYLEKKKTDLFSHFSINMSGTCQVHSLIPLYMCAKFEIKTRNTLRDMVWVDKLGTDDWRGFDNAKTISLRFRWGIKWLSFKYTAAFWMKKKYKLKSFTDIVCCINSVKQ